MLTEGEGGEEKPPITFTCTVRSWYLVRDYSAVLQVEQLTDLVGKLQDARNQVIYYQSCLNGAVSDVRTRRLGGY